MRTIILITLFFIALCASAQRPLESENQSITGEVYPMGKNTYARITISADKNILPYFESMQTRLNPVEIDTIGTEMYYHLQLDAKHYPKTNLKISVNGFSPLNLSWNNLQPNQWIRYYIYDPDTIIVDCFHQLTREGMKLFQAGNYEEAKRKYEEIPKTCSELKDDEKKYIDNQLELIDTLIVWRSIANEYFADMDYAKAKEYNMKIYERNPADELSRSKSIEAERKLSENCKIDFDKAENYFNDKDYANAKILYQKVVDRSCLNTAQAKEKLNWIDVELTNKCRHVLTYEYAKDVPIGLSTGTYKDHKVAGYFTLRLNSDVFEAIRTNNEPDKRPELNVSFGWTIPIVKPVWIFLGPGYTGVGQYVISNNEEQNTTQGEFDLKIHSAISPEIGVLGKIVLGKVGIALRYTFQYRFALEKEIQDYIGSTRHVVGVGICF